MRRRRRLTMLAAAAIAAGVGGRAPPAAAVDARSVVESLPRAWCGRYRWRGDPLIQRFAIAFSKIAVRPKDGRVVALGRATITVPGRRYALTVSATIDPETHRIVLREHRPRPDTPDFTTDGAHRGAMGPHWRSIRAVWTQNRTGERGDLTLHAVGNTGSNPPACTDPSV
jgi:hypothetical protein